MISDANAPKDVACAAAQDVLPRGQRIVVAGGTGFIGRPLVAALARAGNDVTVLSRQERADADVDHRRVRFARWDPNRDPAPLAPLQQADIVYNLIGENIGASRWSAAKRRQLEASRVESTRKIVEALPPSAKVLVNASAISAYPGDGRPYPEDEPCSVTGGFIQEMTRRWEAAASVAALRGVRVVLPRIGVVIGPAGMLDGMLPLFRLRVARSLGSDDPPVPWIDLEDVTRLLTFLAATPEAHGPLNAVGRRPVPFSVFSDEVQRVLGRRSVIGLPGWLLRAALGRDASALVLARYDVVPAKALRLGFVFRHDDLPASLRVHLRGRGLRPGDAPAG